MSPILGLIAVLVIIQPSFAIKLNHNVKPSHNFNGKIIPGPGDGVLIPAKIGEFPFVVQVTNKNNDFQICGGVILTEQFVMIAAHCTQNNGIPADILKVRAGHVNSSNPGPMVQTSDVSDITINPNYTVPIDGNDIAILKLTTPFTFTTAVKAITIPTQGCTVGTIVNDPLLAIGWQDRPDSDLADKLVKVTLQITSQRKCAEILSNESGGLGVLKESMICAGTINNSICISSVDGGIPLVTTKTPKTLIGTFSIQSSENCDTDNFPSIFMRIQQFSNWIKSVISTSNDKNGGRKQKIKTKKTKRL